MRGRVAKVELTDKENRYQYIESAKSIKSRLDLNVLLKRAKDQKKNDKRTNLLILFGAITVAFVVFLILNL